METLTCLECGTELPNLAAHVRKHKMTGTEYKQKHNVDRLMSREFARHLANLSNSKQKENPLYKERRSAIIKKSYTPELIQKRIEDAVKQFEDPKQRQIRREKMTGRKFTEEHKRKLSIPKSEEAKRKLSEINMGKLHPRRQDVIEWRKVRKILRDRSNNSCEVCGVKETELIENGKRGMIVHEKNYNQIIPDPNDCVLCCSKCHRKIHTGTKTSPHQKVARAVAGFLKEMDIDLTSDNFKETPRRFASVLIEFSGLDIDLDLELEEICGSVFEHNGNGVISARNIVVYALCPHHLLPVKYAVSLAYLPKGYAIGLSKLTRLVEVLAKQLQLQERYTAQVADSLIRYLKTRDVAVVIKGEHGCMRIRGVKDANSTVIVSEMRGQFRNDAMIRNEFLGLIQG